MPNFFESNLFPGEKLLFVIKQSYRVLIPRCILIAAWVLFGYLYSGWIEASALFFAAIILIISILPPILRIQSTSVGFTDKKLFGKSGIMQVMTLDSPLDKIVSVIVQYSFWGKIFGYGDVYITSASVNCRIRYVAEPDVFRVAILNQIDLHSSEAIRTQTAEIVKAIQDK